MTSYVWMRYVLVVDQQRSSSTADEHTHELPTGIACEMGNVFKQQFVRSVWLESDGEQIHPHPGNGSVIALTGKAEDDHTHKLSMDRWFLRTSITVMVNGLIQHDSSSKED
ncbi:hypothetical protein P692DRAFT_20872075 [Suillus brevipes Sb2]|nr:hypothetical protein P692DRAFT_20872075 [Suillus brevipes Sb2]